MRVRSLKSVCKRVTALAVAAALLMSGGGPAATAEAAALDHVKATAEDVVIGDYYNSKGVQGTGFADLGDSVANLNLNHMMLNVQLDWFINTDGTGTPYNYKGKTYYFNEQEGSMLKVLLQEVKKYREQGITWTFCLVMGWSDSPEIQKLMYNPVEGKVYYALNSVSAETQDQIAATLHWLTEKFSYKDTFVQNWRVGNEVNVSHNYNYTGAEGSSMPSIITGLATASYNLLYDALQAENPHAKAYVSVTHDWNNSNEGKGVPTRDFLDAFAKGVKDPNWNVDFHAYPPQMKEQVWTKASAQYLTHDVETKFICGANLEVLTNYIKDKFGSNHRIILSEQSYDSTYGQEEQAAMIAQTYYAGAYNDMVDAVIFTTYQDTNSVHHDFYNMGIIDINGNKKKSYDVFRFMNTDQASVYVDPYLNKLSGWTGRTISSWKDDILYKAPATSVTLNSAQLYHPTPDVYRANNRDPEKMVWIGMTTSPSNQDIDLIFNWTAFNYTTNETLKLGTEILGNEWLEWYPKENATYNISCTVRVAGNPGSTMTQSMDIPVNMPGLPASVPPQKPQEPVGEFASFEGYTFHRDEAGDITCKNSAGESVINEFKCDGIYTYYFQANGTAMRSRLTYHPDGIHVIYFDESGHEVFSDFANVRASVAGDPVDDFCFFDVYGYLYVDVVTYDKTGSVLYYANPYGVMERGKWFQFSDTVMCADGTPWTGAAGGYGYANGDGTLMKDNWTYDWLGRLCYMQGNGVALYP